MASQLPILVLLGLVVVPLVLVIGFVRWRAAARRERIRGPWSSLAHKLGGTFREGAGFTGTSITAQRPTHTVHVRMSLVSVMQAVGRPYYPDGGTYTEVQVELLEPRHPRLFVPEGTKTQTFRDHTRIPSLANLGRQAAIYLDPGMARVVLPGVVDDPAYLDAAVTSLEHLTRIILADGPLAPAAA